jgi:hypothetical protein
MDTNFTPNPTPDGPDQEANELALQAKLKEYQQALEQEWQTSHNTDSNATTLTDIKVKTADLLTSAIPKAVGSLLYLAQHAANESVKLKAAQYIIDKGLGGKTASGDPLEALLKELTAKAD